MTDSSDEMDFQTELREDGSIVLKMTRSGEVIAKDVFTAEHAVILATHLLNLATASQRPQIRSSSDIEGGEIFDITSTAVSLADAHDGIGLKLVFWCGKSGLGFSMPPDMAESLFGAAVAANKGKKKH